MFSFVYMYLLKSAMFFFLHLIFHKQYLNILPSEFFRGRKFKEFASLEILVSLETCDSELLEILVSFPCVLVQHGLQRCHLLSHAEQQRTLFFPRL